MTDAGLELSKWHHLSVIVTLSVRSSVVSR
jgi:hypothetical protein